MSEVRIRHNFTPSPSCTGHAVAQLVEALHGRWRVRFPIMSLEFFIDNPSGRAMVLWSTQPLTEMSTRNISWEVKAAGA
jgi:hypothetical protein